MYGLQHIIFYPVVCQWSYFLGTAVADFLTPAAIHFSPFSGWLKCDY